LSWRVITAFRYPPTSLSGKLGILTVGIVALALINFIPFVGWIINLAVVLGGVGVLTGHGLGYLIAKLPAREETAPETTGGN
jgi:hypothetical protein